MKTHSNTEESTAARQPAEPIARRHGAQEDAAFAGSPRQAHAIAQQRAPRSLARGIHRDDPDTGARFPELLHQGIEKRGLPGAWSAGNPHPVRRVGEGAGRQAIEQLQRRLALFAAAVIHQVQRLGDRRAIAGRQAFEQPFHPSGAGAVHRAASPTMSTRSPMIRVRSKSFGV
jgi:hypothetical protein